MHAPLPKSIASEVPVILNGAAGPGHTAEDVERLRAAFRDAGLEARFAPFQGGEDPGELARRALKSRPPVIVAAGGDGTVSAVADAVRGSATALAVVPMGTFNHFAKDAGIALDAVEAVKTLVEGRRIRVDVGEVNGRAFINNASLGLYPKLVLERTRQERRFARSRRTAMLWATLDVVDRSRLLELALELDGRRQHCRAPFVFVGNNAYSLQGFDIGTRARLDEARLNVYTTRRSSARGLVGLALRALFGRLHQAEDFMQTSVQRLRVESSRRRLLVALDGEVHAMQTPLEFRIVPQALQLIVP